VNPSLGFLAGFLWVTLIASVLAYLAYLNLIARIGPDRVAYVVVMVPIVALAVSTAFEDYTWTALSLLGVAVVLLGSILALAGGGSARPAGEPRP